MASSAKKIVVAGATGRTGQELVKQGLARDYDVIALAREPADIAIDHPQLHIAHADMHKPETLEAAIPENADALISALGLFPRKPSTELSSGTENLIAAMHAKELQRLILVSSFGCGGTDMQAPFFLRLFAFRYLFRHTIADKDRQEALVRDLNSDLAYTIFRPAGLYDGPPEQRTHIWQDAKPAGVKRFKTSRSEVARLCLDSLDDPKSIGRTYMLSE